MIVERTPTLYLYIIPPQSPFDLFLSNGNRIGFFLFGCSIYIENIVPQNYQLFVRFIINSSLKIFLIIFWQFRYPK
ncbi:hypothetical protein BN938_0199 [Mucinivorans hirudinis]|uniref:Uncharacterized protein n=1 Tax=Mucinivorans hirudinis TaxID=1433126 RepID=A0A060R5Z6_9BACT|nr:hypothetical protein BN938_0199 [Mucinivorans hirudinis]